MPDRFRRGPDSGDHQQVLLRLQALEAYQRVQDAAFATGYPPGAIAALQAEIVVLQAQVADLQASTVTYPVSIAHGGSGQVTQPAAITALTGTQASGSYLRSNGTAAGLSAIQAADVPTLNQSTTGTAANVTGIVPVANGGSGQSSQPAAITALAGTHAARTFLRGDGTNAVMSAVQPGDVAGGLLRAPVTYAPAVQAVLSTTSALMSAVSSANVSTGSFTCPPSGSVIVSANLIATTNSSAFYAFGLAAHGTTTPLVTQSKILTQSGFPSTFHYLQFLVTGLTPGLSYNFDLMYASQGGNSVSVLAYGNSSTTPPFTVTGGPVIMLVSSSA
jgi:hypothetical protein